MAGTESCIAHPPKHDFLVLRKHMIHLFDGNVCMAAVVSLFEFYTNGELARFARQGEQGTPWVQVSLDVICEKLLGLYSRRSIQESLYGLDEMGILRSVESSGRSSKSYLLDVELLNGLILGGKIASQALGGKIATHPLGGKNDDEIATLRDRRVAELPGEDPRIKSVGSFNEFKERSIEQGSTQNLHPRLDNYTPCDEDGEPEEKPYQRKKWPSRKKQERPKGLGAQIRDLVGPQDGYSPLDRTDTTSGTIPTSPASPQATPRVDYAARWNELVPERKTSAKSAASYRPRFESEFDSICAKVSAIAKSKPDSGWMTFNWLFKSKSGTGQSNWERLLDGEYDWMAKSQPSGVRRGGADPEWVKQQLAEIKARQQKREQEKQRREKELQPDNQRRAD